ncbi:MAG: iron transporter [Vicinamibacterales bacterium]
MATQTKSQRPPMRTSDEAEPKGLTLAKAEGKAYQETLRHMAEEVADTGGSKRAGDYVVAYAIEKAEGMYELHDGVLQWHEPDEENIHIEIAVADGADGRFVPGLDVHVTVVDKDGTELGTHEHPLLWHPYLYHYGRNWVLPADGKYTLKVHIDAPTFPRHDETNGKRYAEAVDVSFEGVKMERGQD